MSEENKTAAVEEVKEKVEEVKETKEAVEEVKEIVVKPIVTEKAAEKETVKEKPKRKNKKRKQEIINNLEEKLEENQEKQEEEELPSKRIKVVKETNKQEDDSEPSLWKGAILKPAMLGILAGASFYVNHVFNTTKPKARAPHPPLSNKPQQQKKNISNSAPFLRVQARHTVPGFL